MFSLGSRFKGVSDGDVKTASHDAQNTKIFKKLRG